MPGLREFSAKLRLSTAQRLVICDMTKGNTGWTPEMDEMYLSTSL